MFQIAAESPGLAACKSCPFRKVNHGKRVPKYMYTEANIRRLWAGASQGERLACTEVASAEKRGEMRECAGLLILIARHLRALDSYASARYQHLATIPLNANGIARWTSRLAQDSTLVPTGNEVTISLEAIDDETIGVPWVCLISNEGGKRN